MLIICITGVSGSGKTTLAQYLADAHGYTEVESCTTRTQRFRGEQGHRFNCLHPSDDFLKHKTAAWCLFDDNYYWVAKDSFVESGKYVYVISPEAVLDLANNLPTAKIYHVHLTVPSLIAGQRMQAEGREATSINRRIIHDKERFAVVANIDMLIDTTIFSPDDIGEAINKFVNIKVKLDGGDSSVSKDQVQRQKNHGLSFHLHEIVIRLMEAIHGLLHQA